MLPSGIPLIKPKSLFLVVGCSCVQVPAAKIVVIIHLLQTKEPLLDNIGRVIPAMAPLAVGGILPGASGICQARVLLNETATHQH
jgi:hypothetical protein